MEGKTRVVIADDQVLYRECLVNLIQLWPEFDVVAQASDGREAVEACRALQPDLVLLDVQMPVMDGVQAAGAIHRDAPGTVIVMLTVATDAPYVLDSLQQGASGYLLKDTPAIELKAKLEEAITGSTVISGQVNGVIVSEVKRLRHALTAQPPEAQTMVESLSKRERDVLYLVAEGLSNEEIAGQLFVSLSTVKKQVASIMRKLQAENRVQIVSRAYKLGLIE